MGARCDWPKARLCTRAGRLGRAARRGRFDVLRAIGGLVSACTTRGLLPCVPVHAPVCATHEHHACPQHRRYPGAPRWDAEFAPPVPSCFDTACGNARSGRRSCRWPAGNAKNRDGSRSKDNRCASHGRFTDDACAGAPGPGTNARAAVVAACSTDTRGPALVIGRSSRIGRTRTACTGDGIPSPAVARKHSTRSGSAAIRDARSPDTCGTDATSTR